jgi:Leucine-rich repeat (LRR) protein
MSGLCVIVGGSFLHMAVTGDSECRSLLGDVLWQGSSPKFVILQNLRGGCNYSVIRSISSTGTPADRGNVLTRLPLALSRLSRLESIVLSGHNIASTGVPAQILDGLALPDLTQLEFGKEAPVSRVLDLSWHGAVSAGSSASDPLSAFPSHALEFMTNLESLLLGGRNISCFPEWEKLKLLGKLRRLDLSGSAISYLPPALLFERPLLQVNLSNTPVSQSLNWSQHNLGARSIRLGYFDWSRMAKTLPTLTSLDLSGNGFSSADARKLELNDLRQLRHLDLSHNPGLTPESASAFSWWKILSEHPSLGTNPSFIGLADVGLAPQHVGFHNRSREGGGLTCEQLHWFRRMIKPSAVGEFKFQDGNIDASAVGGKYYQRLDLRHNPEFTLFVEWSLLEDDSIRCRCFVNQTECVHRDAASEHRELTEAAYFLLLGLLSNMESVSLGRVFKTGSPALSIFRLVDEMPKKMNSFVIDETLLSSCDNFLHRPATFAEENPFNNSAFLSRLSNLEVLRMNCLQMGGSISPEIGKLVKLRSLSLDGNSFRGEIPVEIKYLTNLNSLSLGYNDLTGDIPAVFENLTNLIWLNLGLNTLTGAVPAGIGRLLKLKRLSLSGNQLGGTLSWLSRLTQLNRLELSQNLFNGSVPSTIAKMVHLQRLTLSNNRLSGPILKIIGTLTRLRVLRLGGNSFTGAIPAEMGNLKYLDELQLQNNSFSGPVPLSLLNLSLGDSGVLLLYGNEGLTAGDFPFPSTIGAACTADSFEELKHCGCGRDARRDGRFCDDDFD